MRRSFIILFIIVLLFFEGTLPSPVLAQRGGDNWARQQQQQQMQRQQEMMRQQQRQQEIQRQQQQMRQQQEQMRQQQQRQQQMMRERQQQMQRQMQERQQQAAQQRQQMADRQRQMQQQNQQRSQRQQQEQQRVQGQQQQMKQQQAVQQRQMLQQQRQIKERQERLNRLQDERLRRQQSEQKKEAASIATMASLLGRTKPGALAPSPKATTQSQSLAQFQQRRVQQQAREQMTKVLDTQRKAVKVRLQRMREVKSRMLVKKQMTERQQSKQTENQKRAERNFKVSCVGHGCTCSFHGDTQVLTKNGYAPIKSLVVGKDSVWARNESTGEQDWKPITAHYLNPYKETARVSIRTADGQAQTILSNRIHQFYVNDSRASHGMQGEKSQSAPVPKGQWVQAQQLHPGDQLLTDSGHAAEVLDLEIKEEPLEAYNIIVDDYHTYFVRGSSNIEASAIWVHNDCHDKKDTLGYGPRDFPEVAREISQKQVRHLWGRNEYRGGGYLESLADAQKVLDAFHSGEVTIIGRSTKGFPIIQYTGVTGMHVNKGAGIVGVPTNIFMIKGTKKPSVVPVNPGKGPE